MVQSKNMIIVDVEASGTEHDKHSIVSIGAIDFDNPSNRFYQECRMWEAEDVRGTSSQLVETFCEHCGAKCPTNGQPQLRAHIMDGALEVNGFTEAQITDPSKKSEGEIVAEFIEWSFGMADRTLVGQNVSFDRDFLKAAAHRAKLQWDLPYRTLDTHTMCFMHMIKSGKTPPIDAQHKRSLLDLDAILNYCGVVSEPDPHNALTGALCHAEVTSRLLYSKKLLPEFEQFEIPWLI